MNKQWINRNNLIWIEVLISLWTLKGRSRDVDFRKDQFHVKWKIDIEKYNLHSNIFILTVVLLFINYACSLAVVLIFPFLFFIILLHSIMQVLCRDLKLADAFDFNYLASVTPGYVGADLMSLCREAALCAVTRWQN